MATNTSRRTGLRRLPGSEMRAIRGGAGAGACLVPAGIAIVAARLADLTPQTGFQLGELVIEKTCRDIE